ncbi:rRNA-processing protein cgr-1 [Neurospora hispaniola]|uniref:rRNA-processing protein n=1 Tax=Neurospora hispaniola TaxID=588809 RepID=A0AAJ0MP15_9PEZI|nr:rRNA-processing protein cgr-1 [Neurospora hispaniola]
MSSTTTTTQTTSQVEIKAVFKPLGMRQWHAPKKAFRPGSGLTSFEKRAKERQLLAAVKAKEKELKDEKEAERKRRIEALKEKRAKKEEKERYEKMAEKMHKKRVERLKRKEKRNKLINS